MPNAKPAIGERPTALVACEDPPYAIALARQLESEGYAVERCADAQCVLRRVGRNPFHVIILDLILRREGDVDLVSYVRRQAPDARLILLFEPGQVDQAIDGIRHGAYFYLPKSAQPSDVALVARKALRSLSAERSAAQFEQQAFEEMLGGTPAMKRVIEVVSKVAPTDSTVLLLGESGVGKDLLANTIHRLSRRKEQPFIAVNCAALPETLLESELFGHVKGAFTGAESDKRGLFEEADGGTIFLDEIGDMALVTQAKLLRVLQNGEIRRVGDSVSRHVNVRVIAATNKNLEEAVAARTFREDLYFRLNVVQIAIPPLRDRPDTLPRLLQFFTARAAAQHGKRIDRYDDAALALLRDYAYPGNVRELESIVQHAVIMADDNVVRARDLPESMRRGARPLLALPHPGRDEAGGLVTLREMEERHIRLALERCANNQTEAARKLGISRSTLWRKMKEFGIPAA